MTTNYRMTVRIKADGYLLTISDETGMEISSKRVAASMFRITATELEALLAPEFSLNVHKTRIVLESDVYIFVPDSLFDPEETNAYLAFQHKLTKNERTVFNVVPSRGTVNIFSIPNVLLNALITLVPGCTIEHHMSVLLSDSVTGESDSFHIHVRPGMVDVILVKQSELQLLNSFACQIADDYVYHVMNIIEQLKVDITSTSFYLYNGSVDAGIERHLSNYFAVINR